MENVLLWRDAIHDALAAGQGLTDGERAELTSADDRLVAQAPHIASNFPWVFENTEGIPRERWWWHLDEGPQVRVAA